MWTMLLRQTTSGFLSTAQSFSVQPQTTFKIRTVRISCSKLEHNQRTLDGKMKRISIIIIAVCGLLATAWATENIYMVDGKIAVMVTKEEKPVAEDAEV